MWKAGKDTILKIAKETIDKKRIKKTSWISDETLTEITVRRKIKAKGFNTPVDEMAHRNQNAKIQRMMRKDLEKHINEQCQKIEKNSITNSTKDLYQEWETFLEISNQKTDTIKDENGQILCDGDRVKERWREYCSELYKKNENITSQAVNLQNIENEPPPLLREVEEAIKELKNEKSLGDDEVTAELIKNGGENVVIFYHKLCTKVWIEKNWPEETRYNVVTTEQLLL